MEGEVRFSAKSIIEDKFANVHSVHNKCIQKYQQAPIPHPTPWSGTWSRTYPVEVGEELVEVLLLQELLPRHGQREQVLQHLQDTHVGPLRVEQF